MAAPVAVFQGYDSVVGEGLSTAVEGEIGSVGGTSFVKCDICTSTTQLMDSLQIDQSFSVSYAGLFSISQKLQLVQSLKLTTCSTSIVVFARHVQGLERVTRVQLRDGVTAPADDEQLREFVGSYGDSFLASRTVGGEYYAVYTYYSTSREEQRDLTVEMEAGGLFSGISVDASLGVKISKFNSSQKRRISFQQRMSGIANPTFPTADKITEFALEFPSMELTAPMVIEWTTAGYERIPEIGRKFNPVAQNRELLAGVDASVILSRLNDLQEDIKTLKRLYAFYGGYAGDTKLNEVEAETKKDDKAVRALIAAYRKDPIQALPSPLSLPSLGNGSPSHEYVVQVFGEDDGHGSTPFDDVDLNTYIQQHRRISAIQLRTSPRLVNAIVITYTDDEGTHTVTHGTHDHDPGSTLTLQLVLRPGGFINAVSGNSFRVPSRAPGEVLTRLSIHLDTGESISGGPSGGKSFSWTAEPEGTFLMGFRGRKGWFIDVLQLVYASFRHAKWSAFI